jgi:ketosteroid isomerase-like protein
MAQPVPPQVLDRLQVRERFECWDRDELEPMEEMYAEDAVFDVSAVFIDVAPVRGRGNMRTYWAELRETWRGLRTEPLEVLDVGHGRYVLHLRIWGEGRESGAAVDQRFAFLYTLRPEDNKIIRAKLFPDVETAIAASQSAGSEIV